MNDTLQNAREKRGAWDYLMWALMIASPLVLLGALTLLTGKNHFAGVPVWSDELDYWRGVFSWINVGANTGYYGVGEMIPKIGALSVHGFTPIMLYGGFAAIFGWEFSSIVWINCLWVSAGALCYCLLNRPKAKQALLLALTLLVYAPLVIYAATSMTELANYGLMLFYLAFLVRLYKTRKAARENPQPVDSTRFHWYRGLPSAIFCALTVLFCCAYRITYMVLFVPLVLVAFDGRFSGGMVLAFLGALLATFFAYYFTALYTSPYAAGFLYNFMHTRNLAMAVQMFLSHAKSNLFDYFLRPLANPMESAQRWLYCVTAGLCLLGTFVRFARRDGRLGVRFGFDGWNLLGFLMLAVPFAIVVAAYETNDWSDYRTLAPFLWLVVAALLARGGKLIPTAYLAGCAAILVLLCTSGQGAGSFTEDERFVPKPFTDEIAEACSLIEYDPAATNPYTNTIRVDLYNLQTVSSIHPGMGLQCGWFTEDTTGKSRWILTDHLKIVVEGYEPVYTEATAKVYRLTASYEE